eukprot:CAMPEP_0171075448 /NCGR_PEP_ID=MMETSP0766_2-20121228/12781_1 /TAXON_ID=439317 /ORGANISM="Gambierdiscus australes, Strain CAWD 149" /LENGTH=213 /DNA_ID=CAMNT_0011532317 /DNA_START=78 /DNA_END=719 /DNA_ORIENTATION=+
MGCASSVKTQGKEKAEEVKQKIKVHIGPLELGADGVVVKPKFNLGVQGNGIYAMAGVRDVRDGVAVESLAMAMKSYSSKGTSLVELLESIKAVDNVPVLDDIITSVPDLAAFILKTFDIDIGSNSQEVEGVVHIYTGAGITAGLYFGWVDTAGYRMVGAEGHVAATVGLGATFRAGVHESKNDLRTIIYLSNVGVDAIVRLKSPAPRVEPNEP